MRLNFVSLVYFVVESNSLSGADRVGAIQLGRSLALPGAAALCGAAVSRRLEDHRRCLSPGSLCFESW